MTVLFADLTGFTTLSEKLDSEETRQIIGEVFARAADVVGHYEGRIEEFIGDALMALFGVPIAHEDDPARAQRDRTARTGQRQRIPASPFDESVRRPDVLVQAEEIGRVVPVLQLDEPRMVLAVSGTDSILTLVTEIVCVDAAGRIGPEGTP